MSDYLIEKKEETAFSALSTRYSHARVIHASYCTVAVSQLADSVQYIFSLSGIAIKMLMSGRLGFLFKFTIVAVLHMCVEGEILLRFDIFVFFNCFC